MESKTQGLEEEISVVAEGLKFSLKVEVSAQLLSC